MLRERKPRISRRLQEFIDRTVAFCRSVDVFLYALINFVEAIVGLVTLGRYYPPLTFKLDPYIWKLCRKDWP